MIYSAIATVSSKNQFTIPIDMARFFNISQGTRLKVNAYDDRIEIIPANKGLDEFVGKFANNKIAKKYANLSWNELVKTPEWHKAEYENAKRIANAR